MTRYRLTDDVLEKLTAAVASLKRIAFNHLAQMPLKRRNIAFSFCKFREFRDSAISGGRWLHIGNLRVRFSHSINRHVYPGFFHETPDTENELCLNLAGSVERSHGIVASDPINASASSPKGRRFAHLSRGYLPLSR